MSIPVTILPSHPAEGWMSMNRHWAAMMSQIGKYEGNKFDFRCPLKQVDLLSNRQGKLKLLLEKQIAYPARVRRTASPGIAHILDHSYAFLLKDVPKGVKTVVTVHDLLPLREPDGLGKGALKRFRSRIEWVRRADVILSVSNSTKQDLVEFIKELPERIQIVPMGTDLVEGGDPGTTLPRNLQPGFLFSIGGYMKRKNLEILPAILEKVRKAGPDIKLVRAGGLLPEQLVREFADRCGNGALIELGKVSEDVLGSLYRDALATIVPSRFEGFGLPVIEAMARGCPVICARTTSLPEVGGDAALYFDVDDAARAADEILKLRNASIEWKSSLKRRGLDRAKRFTWDVHFSRLLDIYDNM